jgi:hypothetical protein
MIAKMFKNINRFDLFLKNNIKKTWLAPSLSAGDCLVALTTLVSAASSEKLSLFFRAMLMLPELSLSCGTRLTRTSSKKLTLFLRAM